MLANSFDQLDILFDGEQKFLDEIKRVLVAISLDEKDDLTLDSAARLFNQVNSGSYKPIIVMFLPSSSTRDRLALKAKSKFLDFDVLTPVEIEKDRPRFEQILIKPSLPTLIILDTDHEEGMNLSTADAMVHYDLLFDVSRLEQRIGRIDRFGRKKGVIKHRIILPSDNENSFWHSWLDVLIEGFQIFHGSVSNVQFLIDNLTENLFRQVLKSGAQSFKNNSLEVQKKIDKERLEQDEQFALDRITNQQTDTNTILSQLEDVEVYEEEFKNSCEKWLFDTLYLYKKITDYPDFDLFKSEKSNLTLIPLKPWMQQIESAVSPKLTWKRYKATVNQGTQVLRPGCLIFDRLERFTDWDDRGRVYATYRKVPGWTGDKLIFFKLDMLIKPTFKLTNFLEPSISDRAILRKLNSYFPTTEIVVYLDLQCRELDDPSLIKFLEKKYSRKSDKNLCSRLDEFNEYLDLHSHQIVSRSMRNAAQGIIRQRTDIKDLQNRANSKIISDLRKFNLIAEQRAGNEESIRNQRETLEKIHRSVNQLDFKVDAFGCFVIGA